MGRRTGLVVVLTALVVLAATVAGTSLGSSDRTHAASGTVVLSGWGASPDELKLLKAVIRGFEKTFPKINVDYQPITGDYVPSMLAKFSARKPPDVFYVDSNVFLDWVTQGLLEPLDSYAQKTKFSSKPFYASLLNGFKYKGKIYGYPKDWSPLAMEVNTALAAKAGVNPSKIKTWKDLTVAAKKLKPVVGSDGRAICLNPSWDRALAFVYENNGTFLNASKTKSTINSPAAKAAMDFYVGLIKQGLADIPAKLGVDWCGAALGKQKAAIIFEGNWLFPYMQSTYPGRQVQHAADDPEQAAREPRVHGLVLDGEGLGEQGRCVAADPLPRRPLRDEDVDVEGTRAPVAQGRQAGRGPHAVPLDAPRRTRGSSRRSSAR